MLGLLGVAVRLGLGVGLGVDGMGWGEGVDGMGWDGMGQSGVVLGGVA